MALQMTGGIDTGGPGGFGGPGGGGQGEDDGPDGPMVGVNVRRATPYDISTLVVLIEKMREESPLAYPPIDYTKLVSVLNDVSSRFLCAIAENEEGQVIGMAGATIDEWFFLKWLPCR